MNNYINNKIHLNEIIIVEGRDDVTAVKRVVSSEVIPLHGFTGMTKNKIDFLIELSKKNNLILLTDPDFVGKKLREVISKRIPNIKHAYITREQGTRNYENGRKNIGIENASNESIILALSNVIKPTYNNKIINNNEYIFTTQDLIEYNLSIGENSKDNRQKLGDYLNIGYHNSKQLLKILNCLSITKNEFIEIMNNINHKG